MKQYYRKAKGHYDSMVLRNIINPWSALMSLGAVLGGTGAAVLHGNVEPFLASIIALFAMFTQLTTNVMHKYFLAVRYKKNHPDDTRIIKTSEGISLISFLPKIAQVFGLLAIMCGFTIMGMTNLWAIILGIITFGLCYIAANGKPKFTASFWGMLVAFLLMGPVAMAGSCLVEASRDANNGILNWFDLAPALYMSLIGGTMGVGCNLMYAFRNQEDPLAPLQIKEQTKRLSPKTVKIVMIITGIVEMTVSSAVAFSIATEQDIIWWLISTACGIGCLAINLAIVIKLPKKGDEVPEWMMTLLYIKCFVGGLLALLHFAVIGLPNDAPRDVF